MHGHCYRHARPRPQAQLLLLHPVPAGLLFFRHGKNTTHFIDAWQAKLDADEKVGWG